MIATPSRRRLIVVILLGFAVAGAAMRHFAAPASLTRDIGTLLMVLWLPVIGSVIGWLIARARRRPVAAPAPTFAAGSAFDPHALVELTLRPSQLPSDNTLVTEGEHRCALVVNNQGFSARWFVAADEVLRRGTAHALEVEFLTPSVALPQFPRGAVFRMLVGEAFVADGRVLQLLGGPKLP